MKKIKYITLATIVWAWIITSSAFADSNTDQSNYESTSQSWFEQRQRSDTWFAYSFLKTDLTDTQKEEVKNILNANEDKMKALMSNYWTWTDISTNESFQSEAKVIRWELTTNLLPYIKSDKQDVFKTEMEKVQTMKQNSRNDRNNRWTNESQNNQNTNKTKYKIPDKTVSAIDTRLGQISSNSDKLTWLNAVNTKIAALADRVSSESSKNILSALKEIIDQRIDTINWNWVDSDIIDGLFE